MTEWFNRRPGDVAATHTEDPTMLLLGDAPPDWVKAPPEVGVDGPIKVQGAHRAPCPMCQDGPDVRHLELEKGLGVAECSAHGFVWYRRRPV